MDERLERRRGDRFYLHKFSEGIRLHTPSRLLFKLRSYEITDQVLRWIKSFLLNCKQRVVVNGMTSEWKDVISGVPQGSVLGLILFVIFINDIMDGLVTTPYLFADDMNIFKRICNVADQHTLQRDLVKIFDWTKIWY